MADHRFSDHCSMEFTMQRSALALLLVFVSFCANASEVSQRSVKVTGTSVAKVIPDEVTWTVTVTTIDPKLSTAREQNDAAITKVLALKEELGIKDKDIQTGYLQIRKIYQRDRQNNQGEFRHYSINRIVTLRQTTISKFDIALQKLTEIKEIQARYQLSSSKFHDVRRQTRLKAVAVARDKAKEMTELLGARLGSVLKIDATEKQSAGFPSITSNSLYTASQPNTPDSVQGTFAPGAIEVRVSVDLEFAIE